MTDSVIEGALDLTAVARYANLAILKACHWQNYAFICLEILP